MGIKQLSKSDIKRLNEGLVVYGLDSFFDKKDTVRIEDDSFLFRDSELLFFKHNNVWVPVLKFLLKQLVLKKITVDMGAVPFMVKGADVLRPGVTAVDDAISKGDVVAVVDERHGKPLCVAVASFNSEEMRAAEKGSIAKNIHFVGDEIWNK